MPLLNDAANAAQAMLGLRTQNTQNGENNESGAPPAQVTPPGVLPPAPAIGANPRLIDKLKKEGAEEISNETWSLFEEAASDEDAQDDVRAMLTNPTSHVYSLWMNPKTAEVALGHSTFVCIAQKGKDDPFHRCGIVFIKDRSDRRDPMAYAVEKADFKKWGDGSK